MGVGVSEATMETPGAASSAGNALRSLRSALSDKTEVYYGENVIVEDVILEILSVLFIHRAAFF